MRLLIDTDGCSFRLVLFSESLSVGMELCVSLGDGSTFAVLYLASFDFALCFLR